MMMPKPLGKRLDRGSAVTILAGFKCIDGVVICADTQETVSHSKKSVPKLLIDTPPHWKGYNAEQYPSSMAVAFCGSGWGPMIDKVIGKAWERMKPCSFMDETCQAAEESIKETFTEFSSIYQPGQMPEIELIYGITLDGESRLFSANGPVVNDHKGWVGEGAGGYMVDFLASKMYGGHLTTRQCVILAAYVLQQAKEHVDGCGGESHIAVLRDSGSSGQVNFRFVDHVTEMLKSFDAEFGRLLLESADINATKQQIMESRELVASIVDATREYQAKELNESWKQIRSLFRQGSAQDDMGLAMETRPLASDSSEDSP